MFGTRLETIPSIGPVIASALRARVTDAKLFENGRHLAAWIGIVPENNLTGGKDKQKGLSKKGDRYLRSLSRHRRDGRRAAGADPSGQESRGHEAAWPHVGHAGGDRDRQQDRADRLGDHGPRRRLRGRPSPRPLSSRSVRGDRIAATLRRMIATPEARGTRRKASRVAEVLMA